LSWTDVWEIGVAEGFGVFFLLFLGAVYLFWRFVQRVMQENQDREMRYLENIEKLSSAVSSIEKITQCLVEMRAEQKERHDLMIELLTGQIGNRQTARKERGDIRRRDDDRLKEEE